MGISQIMVARKENFVSEKRKQSCSWGVIMCEFCRKNRRRLWDVFICEVNHFNIATSFWELPHRNIKRPQF